MVGVSSVHFFGDFRIFLNVAKPLSPVAKPIIPIVCLDIFAIEMFCD